MVLNIALEGVDGVGKTTQLEHLQRFFSKKNYKVTIVRQPNNIELIEFMRNNNLTNSELALCMALDRSLTYNMIKPFIEHNAFDLILWDRSILSSYAYNTDDTVDNKFITDINKYFPKMDLYIIIESSQFLDIPDYSNKHENTISKYQKLEQENENIISIPYIPNKENKVFESIVQTIFENLPRCGWCGKLFEKNNKHRKYCSTKCSDNAREEQNRIHALNFYHKYKKGLPGKLGSYGANLHGHRNEDMEKEHQLILNEKKRLNL